MARVRFNYFGSWLDQDHPDLHELVVDGVTVWEKPKPKVRVHPSNQYHEFIQEMGEFDLYRDKATYTMYAFPATYE